jgi:hypothetical protein
MWERLDFSKGLVMKAVMLYLDLDRNAIFSVGLDTEERPLLG